MTDSEIARLEEQLRLTLPRNYVDIVRRLGADVETLRGSLGKGMHRPLMWSGLEVLDVNQLVRRDAALACTAPAEFAKGWPAHYLVCGYERAGMIYYVVDTRKKDLRVFQVLAKNKTLEPCPAHPDLAGLADYALTLYRKFSAKEKGVRATQSMPRPGPKTPLPATEAGGGSSVRPASLEAAVTAMQKLLADAGFKLEQPSRKHSIEALTSDMPSLPEEVHALYVLCDGGRCARLGRLRVLPLAEAARLAKTFAGWRPTMAYFPVLDDDPSDPCCVCTAGPLKGYVIFVNHDGPDVILARSLSRFLSILARTPANKDWTLEDAMYEPTPTKHVPFEFAGPERTADDARAARTLLKLAELCVGDDEYVHLFEIALKLFSDEQIGEIAPLLKHRDHDVRRAAKERLSESKSSEAAAS
jgi:cell wall assembly regulator SMI1